MHEPQVESDAQLREAEKILKALDVDLLKSKHPKAMVHVQNALKELETALKIR